jgi:hypothetical protein
MFYDLEQREYVTTSLAEWGKQYCRRPGRQSPRRGKEGGKMNTLNKNVNFALKNFKLLT